MWAEFGTNGNTHLSEFFHPYRGWEKHGVISLVGMFPQTILLSNEYENKVYQLKTESERSFLVQSLDQDYLFLEAIKKFMLK